MVVVMPILAIVYFFVFLYLRLRNGTDRITWPVFIFSIIYFGVAAITKTFDNPSLVFIPLFLASLLAFVIAFFIQRRKAGSVILTYKRNTRSIVNTITVIILILLMSYFISIPNVRTYPGGELVYDDSYFRERLPMSIFFGLVSLAYIPIIFRKGEFLEKGFATPDLQFFPWNSYQSYNWLEDVNKKHEERFSLFLSGEKGASRTVHGFSESTKNILDEVLIQKIPTQNPPT